MFIGGLAWTDRSIQHIARHEIEPSEVDDICSGSGRVLVLRVGSGRHRKGRYAVYGQTDGGRYAVAFLDRIVGATFDPVTAPDVTAAERRRYVRLT